MLRELFVLVLLAVVGHALSSSAGVEKTLDLFERALEKYVRTGETNQELAEAVKELQFPGLFRQDYKRNTKAGPLCVACNILMNAIIEAKRRLGVPTELLADILITICTLTKIEPAHICKGAVMPHKDTLEYIIDNNENLNGKRVCAILMQGQGCNDGSTGGDWSITLPDEPTPLLHLKNESDSSVRATTLKVLQLTDIHFDPDYTTGSNANCGDPLCCQPGSLPEKPEDAAGYWGDYRSCDTPWTVLVDSITHIVSQHKKLDYVYYTGDIVDHKFWDSNIERNAESMIRVLNLFKSSFGNVKVFPILGNHEPYPVNAFSSDGVNPQISTQWIFDLAAKEWLEWLPESTKETILKGGYYTVKLPGSYRIIALNSNVCFNLNWWLLYDDNDPFGQLKWLVEVLTEAETNKEKVHILSHVPSADDTCWDNWAREYSRILKRFSKTIVAQFTGHTHKKENIIYYNDDKLAEPVGVAFNGGSLTTYTNVNPNYVVYDINSDTGEVQDYELWYYDVTEANKVPEAAPKWEKLYSFKDAYNVQGLSPVDLDNLAKTFTTMAGQDLVKKYHEYKYRSAAPALDKGCDEECHLENLCYMVRSHHHHTSSCEEIKKLWAIEHTESGPNSNSQLEH